MNWFKKIAKTLYHGTSINNYNSIKNIGVIPNVGDFVTDSYQDEYENAGVDFDITPLVYATDKEDLDKAVTAMKYSISKYLGKTYHDVTVDDIRSYGMIVIIKNGDNYFNQRPYDNEGHRDWQWETNNMYPAVEPGDYFSEDSISGDILIGNKLIDFLKRNNQLESEDLRNDLLTMAIRYHVKQNPELRDKIVKTVQEKVNNLSEDKVKSYYNTYKEWINNELVY